MKLELVVSGSTGTPTTIKVLRQGTEPAVPMVHVVSGQSSFDVPVVWRANEGIGQFTPYLPGTYTVQAGPTELALDIKATENLSFLSEFGLLSALVLVTFLGVITWTRKKCRKKEKSFSCSGQSSLS